MPANNICDISAKLPTNAKLLQPLMMQDPFGFSLCIPFKLIPALTLYPTISILWFEGFPYVQKPPVIADQSGYIGNFVTNHKRAFFVFDQ